MANYLKTEIEKHHRPNTDLSDLVMRVSALETNAAELPISSGQSSALDALTQRVSALEESVAIPIKVHATHIFITNSFFFHHSSSKYYKSTP